MVGPGWMVKLCHPRLNLSREIRCSVLKQQLGTHEGHERRGRPELQLNTFHAKLQSDVGQRAGHGEKITKYRGIRTSCLSCLNQFRKSSLGHSVICFNPVDTTIHDSGKGFFLSARGIHARFEELYSRHDSSIN